MQPHTSLPCKHCLPGIVPFTSLYMERPQLESSIRGASTIFVSCSGYFSQAHSPFTISCTSSLCHVFYCFSHAYLPFHNVKQIFCLAIHFDLGEAWPPLCCYQVLYQTLQLYQIYMHIFCVPDFTTQGNVTFFLPAAMVPWQL